MRQDLAVTVDAVIFLEENNALYLLVIKRKNQPFQGHWALPGGFLEEDELLQTGCLRELEEETGLQLQQLEKVGIYDAINRDPRGRTLSVAFTAKLQERKQICANDDADEAKWILLKDIEEMAFDHHQIIQDAIKKLQIAL
ncbi:NUDIX domain-containing protein [Mesonia aestuariivivens]|uniref:NUDIX hydrolase n=1 Tax=Mesonia aestuariivivens TaxID=2796128 RepID=A0ABS6VYR0_9FLAO|nr:NUDIX hydrolase [Mesonia aestuariivivens]MBW2960720.1 NUDIX hydrolase [Mesonia aestuariivivens]